MSKKVYILIVLVLAAVFAVSTFFIVCFSKQKPPAQPVESKSLDKRNPPLL